MEEDNIDSQDGKIMVTSAQTGNCCDVDSSHDGNYCDVGNSQDVTIVTFAKGSRQLKNCILATQRTVPIVTPATHRTITIMTSPIHNTLYTVTKKSCYGIGD